MSDKQLTQDVLEMIKFDLETAGFKVKQYKSVYGWGSGCLQVLGGHLLPSIFLFVDGSRLLFSRYMNVNKQKHSKGGLRYMELADPTAKPSELLLKLFGADSDLKKSLRVYGRSGF